MDVANRENNCRLLALPKELRLQIFESVYSERIDYELRGRSGRILAVEQWNLTALLSTCKSVNLEATPCFYEQLYFKVNLNFDDEKPLMFTEKIWPPLHRVKYICLDFGMMGAMRLRLAAMHVEQICQQLDDQTLKICKVKKYRSRRSTHMVLAMKAKFEQEISRLAVDLTADTAAAKIYASLLTRCEYEIELSKLPLAEYNLRRQTSLAAADDAWETIKGGEPV